MAGFSGMFGKSVPPAAPETASPCVGICVLDDDSVCTGCGRQIDEIAGWARASEARRQQVVRDARERLQRAQSDGPGTDGTPKSEGNDGSR